MTKAPVIRCESVTIRFPLPPTTGSTHNREAHPEGAYSSPSKTQRSIGPLTFSIARGEKVLLLGPSGCGKSTILRAMTGAMPHAIHAQVDGEVELNGQDMAVTAPNQCAAHVGIVQQDPWASVCLPVVEDDIAFPLENAATPAHQIEGAVQSAAIAANVVGLLKRRAATLSGGQLQRTALATAVVTDPGILILDEPTSMLDAEGIYTVGQAIARTMSSKSCVVMVEHRLDELADSFGHEFLPSRWIVLAQDGQILWDGDPTTIDATTARHLVQHGCWLPLDVELLGVLGLRGGLDNPELEARLRDTTTPTRREDSPPSRTADTTPPDGGNTSRIVVTDLAVTAQQFLTGTSKGAHTPVLEHLDFDLVPGEITALVGENGSGKTTLLRTLAGVHQPLDGTIRTERGDAIHAGLIFQNPEHQFMTNTVRAELAYGLPAERLPVVDELLATFALTECAEQSPFSLSGGQKRRLSLAAIIAHDYDVLLADEPTFGLDRHSAMNVLNSLRNYSAQRKAVVMASHDMRAVAAYADRVLVVGQGKLLAQVTPLELFRDTSLLTHAGLRVPRLVEWFAMCTSSTKELSARLRAFDAAAVAPSTWRANNRSEELVSSEVSG